MARHVETAFRRVRIGVFEMLEVGGTLQFMEQGDAVLTGGPRYEGRKSMQQNRAGSYKQQPLYSAPPRVSPMTE